MSNKRNKNQRKKQLKKKRSQSQANILAKENKPSKNTYLSGFNITNEPLRTSHELPDDADKQLEECYWNLQKKKKIPETLAILMDLKATYPDNPKIYNYLGIVYKIMGDRDKFFKITQECYQKHPDYLFGRLSYIDECLERNDYEKAEEIFDGKFDLKSMYPERNTFHFSEVQTFFSIVGFFYAKTGDKEAAKTCIRILKHIEADESFINRILIEIESPEFMSLLQGIRNFADKY